MAPPGMGRQLHPFPGTREQREQAAQVVAGAFMAVFQWWLDRGAKPTATEVDALFRRLVLRGLEAS